jgi:hypothetical protein
MPAADVLNRRKFEWFVMVCVVILGIGSWYAIGVFEDPMDPPVDPSRPIVCRMLRIALVLPALFALQPWLRWLRITGFALLLWLPCFIGMLLLLPVEGGVPNPGLQTSYPSVLRTWRKDRGTN